MLRVVLQLTSIPDYIKAFHKLLDRQFFGEFSYFEKLFSFRATFALRIWKWKDFTNYRKIPNCQNVYYPYFLMSAELDTNG